MAKFVTFTSLPQRNVTVSRRSSSSGRFAGSRGRGGGELRSGEKVD